MDFEKFTEKSRSFIQKAQTLAMRSGHQSLEPEHMLRVMLDDEDGQLKRVIVSAGGGFDRLSRDIDVSLTKIPAVSGSGAGQLRISSDLSKVLDNALILSEKSGDKFITAERVLQSMMLAKATGVEDLLVSCGLTSVRLNQAIQDMRKGRTADTANAEGGFDALNRYARDLTLDAREGKLDPVIGRD